MKLKSLILAAVVFASALPSAFATVAGGPYNAVGYCSLRADLLIKSGHLVVGKSTGQGFGEIVCNYVGGAEEVIPVIVSTKGYGLGFGRSISNGELVAAGIGVMRDGYDLIGNYATVKGSAQILGLGAEVGVNFRITRNGFSIPVELKVKHGRGLELAADVGEIWIDVDYARLNAMNGAGGLY